MHISRRDFLRYCTASAVGIGLDPFDLTGLNQALANPSAPSVIWLQGSGCTGCSISFLNYVSPTPPTNAADILISSINLIYHPNLSGAAGATAVAAIRKTYGAGNYILAVEGGIPTAFGGAPCWAWTENGTDVTMQRAVSELASRASKILCMGTCASWGGIPASGPNPTGIRGVRALTGKTTINISGCPPHPNWMVWTIVQLLQGKPISVDASGRPTYFYGKKLHESCPLKETDEIKTFGVNNRCLKALGCRGPETHSNCPSLKWNYGVNWCIGANAPCLGCTSATFPGTTPFYKLPY